MEGLVRRPAIGRPGRLVLQRQVVDRHDLCVGSDNDRKDLQEKATRSAMGLAGRAHSSSWLATFAPGSCEVRW